MAINHGKQIIASKPYQADHGKTSYDKQTMAIRT
jgi:hypothetical protein